ncbi:MAG TPA: hypothetical protein VNT75_19990 [Symbiobacteriaceae bacterium]|nr:hypothetical protein [Symbiobacteriaceae bacterium]
MSGPVTFSGSQPARFRCLTGVVQQAEQIGIFQRGTHRLVAPNRQVIATLRSNQVNLTALEGRAAAVCGFDEGEIEGVTSLLVTFAVPLQIAF